jgi:uncharacterized protein
MKTLEKTRNKKLLETLEELKKRIRDIAGDGVRLILYGSYARGQEQEDSDVDIMIVLPDDKSTTEMKDRVWDEVFEVGYKNDFLLSAIIVDESQTRKFEGFKVFASVVREGIILS